MRRITIRIEGMQCGGCVIAVRDALHRVPGTHVEEVSLGTARVAYDPLRTDLQAIRDAISSAGYQPAMTSLHVGSLPA